MRLSAALICVLAVLLLSACGSGSSPTNAGSTGGEVKKAAAAAAARRARAEARAPKGASPTLRAIYAEFPPPKPDPEVKGSTVAIQAGIEACKGKTPVEVKEEFYPSAKANLSSEQAKMIGRIGSFEAHYTTDANFTAGQLAADSYEATLPEGTATYGYQGCVYSLARGLERKIAP